MFREMKVLILCALLPALTGCTSIMTYFEELQKQSVDDFDKRSVEFRPQYRFKAPERKNLTPREQRLVGAPPPPKGVVLLDGTRYFSANGHVCHLIKDSRRASSAAGTGSRSACFVRGRWVLAVPVLNTRVLGQ